MTIRDDSSRSTKITLPFDIFPACDNLLKLMQRPSTYFWWFTKFYAYGFWADCSPF